MSRHNQDIPIRPRYGYEGDDTNRDEPPGKAEENVDQSRLEQSPAKDQHRIMATSYSEIPFLAQYSVAVTPTSQQISSTAANSGLGAGDGDDDDDVDADESNSKSSSCEIRQAPKRPDSLQYGDSTAPYELGGSVRRDGQMLHFVANNLEDTLKTTSPGSKTETNQIATSATYSSRNSTPSASTTGVLLTRHFLQSQLPQIDANVLNDIEIEAQYLAASVDNLTENLCNLLHSISSITADNVEVHKNAVSKLTDCMDANIKCMYTIMAKTEEISKSMKPTEQLGQRIREIKRLVDMLESNM